MTTYDITDTANQVTMQRLLLRYFSSQQRYATRQIAGATFTVEPSRHRTGIPKDASCQRYVIMHVAQGWTVVARTVWCNGRLLEPRAVHTRLDHYLDDEDRHGSAEAVANAFNGWLLTLDL